MYKVFVNNKPLLISEKEQEGVKNIPYKIPANFEEAVHLLYSHLHAVNIYGMDKDVIFEKFCAYFKTIEAAGGIVLNEEQKILIIHRLGKWDLPKGKMEKGESPSEAAVREVEEECGITQPKLNYLVNETYHMYFDKEYILKRTYWFEMQYDGDELLVPQLEEGIEKVEWRARNEMEDVMENTYPNILELLQYYDSVNRN